MIRFRSVFAIGLIWLLGWSQPAIAVAENFPQPSELSRDVEFWTKVYTEIDTASGYIHDAKNLGVIYETIEIQPGQSRRTSQRKINERKKSYRRILEKLSTGKREGLKPGEQRVLELWPVDVTNAELRRASRQIRFQLGQSDRFRDGIIRAGEWEDEIRDIFSAYGLPEELAMLPHVESSYNPVAYSSAHAVGLWQIVRSTGRQYMRIDHVVDERLDPLMASDAAARLLRDNYAATGSWPLALTAYNHGVAGMKRAVRQLGTTDIATIARRYDGRVFGFASRNFYVSFLAAIEVSQNYERYFGPLKRRPAASYQVVVLSDFVPVASLSAAIAIDTETLRRHNPALRDSVWTGTKYVPAGFELRLPAYMNKTTELIAAIPATGRFSHQLPDVTYTVRRGDTLSYISARFGHSERDLVALNGLRSRHRIRVGQTLKLPQSAPPQPVVVHKPGTVEESKQAHYVVRWGDSIDRIARRVGVSADQLVAINNLPNKHRIYVGQSLAISGESAVPRQTISVARAADEPIKNAGSSRPPLHYGTQPYARGVNPAWMATPLY